MTSEQAQAAREVAEAVHGPLSDRWCYYAECGIEECEDALDECEIEDIEAGTQTGIFKHPCYPKQNPHCVTWTPVPDLFATTPDGAAAREEAEAWLFDQGWHCWRAEHHSHGCNNYRIGYGHRSNAHGVGSTLAEARANAIVSAVRAMRGVKDG